MTFSSFPTPGESPNAAAAGMSPIKIMQMAGRSDFKTTQRYIDLAGVVFADEVNVARGLVRRVRYQEPVPSRAG